MRVGFIGLGTIGKPMARHLMEEGLDLVVWNRTESKSKDLGVQVALNPREVVSKSEVVVLSLRDSNAVREVLFGQNGIIHGECLGKIIIDTRTNHFESVSEFYDKLEDKKAHYLECPVVGSVIPASQGRLTMFVSGDEKAFNDSKHLLEKIAANIVYLKERGLATKMKLINNFVLGVFMTALSEAIILGEKIGLSKEKVVEILSVGAGNSLVLKAKQGKILNEDFSTHFSSELLYKDLSYAQDLARVLKSPLFTGSVVKELYALTFVKEMEKLDFAVIYKLLKEK